MNTVKDILYSFDSITLEEMDSVKLLDRIDKKFTFRIEKLSAILEDVKNDYKVLDVNGIRINSYKTLYFDTNDFKLYLQHHNGKLNRYKVRFRRYCDSGLNYFEVKFKNNKNRTIKERVKRSEMHSDIERKSEKLLIEKTPLLPNMLKPVIWVYYSRITLVSMLSKERLTIDIDLNFKNNENEKSFPNLVIAEVKQAKSEKSPFISIMQKNRIFEGALSKYCFGISCLNNQIKKNNFKIKFREINKLCYDNN